MPKVASFTAEGLELWFNSNDHLPPHFHAEKPGEWGVRVYFLRSQNEMIGKVYSFKHNRPSNSDLEELKRLAEANRAALLQEWEAKVQVSDPGSHR